MAEDDLEFEELKDCNFKITDSLVDRLKRLRNFIRVRNQDHKYGIIGRSAYLASLLVINKSFNRDIEHYKKSQLVSPAIEIRRFSEILYKIWNALNSRNKSVSDIHNELERKIEEEETELGLDRLLKRKGEEKKKIGTDRIFGQFFYLRDIEEKKEIFLNGFYKDLGMELETLFIGDPDPEKEHEPHNKFKKKYEYFEHQYVKIGKKRSEEPYDTRIDIKRAELTGRYLGSIEEKLVRGAIRDIQKRRRLN